MNASSAPRETIVAALADIEKAQSVKSVNSDWDVRFIYRRPLNAYISLDSPPEQVERSGAAPFGPLDAVGWDIYPPGVAIPRDVMSHILEHGGVFVGYNCGPNDSACDAVVQRVKSLVEDRLQSGGRVVMAYDDDLVPGTVGLSSWTRVFVFTFEDFDERETQRFLDVNSCRYDPEGFCP